MVSSFGCGPHAKKTDLKLEQTATGNSHLIIQTENSASFVLLTGLFLSKV